MTTEYVKAHQKLKFICPNNHENEITWNNWTEGKRCSKCSCIISKQEIELKDFIKECIVSKRMSIEKIKESFESEGYQLLTTEYLNNRQKLEFVCPKGHIHHITWDNWISKGIRCAICSGRYKTIEEVKESFELEGYQLLTSDYKNNKEKLEFVCPNGHEHVISFDAWSRGQRCGLCAQEQKKEGFGSNMEINDVRNSFEAEGYQLLTTEYVNAHQKLEFICPKGHRHTINWNNWKSGYRCGVCAANMSGSKQELELKEFFKETSDIVENDRSIIAPLELDIVISSKKIAVEYCGLYWHSELAGKKRNYHLTKLKKCEYAGYQLITIFEDEWLFQNEIVKARLKHLLGSSDIKSMHARKCQIKEITVRESSPFLKKYHIQGVGGSKVKLGAFHNDKLVSVMTFSRPSIAKGSRGKDFWELNRFCSHSEYHIPGIASKLLKYFERNYEWEKIISYADRRWSNGNLYKQLGFETVLETNPNYWYFNRETRRIHRFALRKKSDEPKDKTEWELRKAEGWNRIWDCGSLKFEKDIKSTLGGL